MSKITLNELAFKNLKAVKDHLKNKTHFTFVFLGDNRGENASNPINEKILKEILHQIGKLKEKPAFVLDGGDLTFTGTVENLKKFKSIVEHSDLVNNKKVPFFAIPGNHDTEHIGGNLKNFHTIIGDSQFVISMTPTFEFQVLAMNNVTSLPAKNNKVHYGFSQDAIKFMNNHVNDLTKKSNGTGKTVIAFHAPPGLGCWKNHGMGPNQTKKFINNVIKTHSKQEIPLVLTSHIHGFSEMHKNGKTTYVLSGGGGAPLEEGPGFNCVKPVFNFVEFKVTKNSKTGSLTITGTVHKKTKKGWVSSKIPV